MPYSHTAAAAAAAARQHTDEATAAYGSWLSRQHASHLDAVLPSVPDVPEVPDFSGSVPADYGAEEFLLDEQVQAMLVDVISASGSELPVAAPAGKAAAELQLQQQQRSMVRRSEGLPRQMSADSSYGRLPGMPKAAPAPAPAPAGGSFDSASDALSALSSYMMRHEQQKQRHQQCISAAAAAAALNASSSGGSSPAGPSVSYSSGMPAGAMSGGVSGLVSLAGTAGLSRQAQVKLQELMAAQQLQLEIQMELLQLLSAA
jgi:hypothetical protein